jgi:(p)ppGpp synthase/HD superfamily hydrolase
MSERRFDSNARTPGIRYSKSHCGNGHMELTDRFLDALTYAVGLHEGQQRKVSGTPYAAHLLTVTAMVLENGGNEDEAIAALLHDAVEDRGGLATRAIIAQRFGEQVACMVDGCSDCHTAPKPPWHERKERYLDHLPHAPASVRLIVAADKLHNVRALLADYRRLGDAVWQHFRGGREGTLWYSRAVVDTLRTGDQRPIIDELERAVAELENAVA